MDGTAPGGQLSATQVEGFHREGYATVPGFLGPEQVRHLARALGGEATDDPTENPLSLGSMQFASNVYRSSADVCELLSSEAVASVVSALLGPDAWVRWDQAVWKRPGAPEFPMHQDNGYTGLDAEHLQLWFALTPSHPANGGLRVVPSGHRSRLDHRWIGNHVHAAPEGTTVDIEADPGDLVAFSSWLPHATPPNTTDETRLAYVAEFLPLGTADPGVPFPHLVACELGRPSGRWASGP